MTNWIPVEEFPDYEVAWSGKIRHRRTKKEVPISSTGSDSGKVNLMRRGSCHSRSAGRIVCRAFHGPPEPGQVVIYRNDDYSDVSGTNVRWGSRSELWERRQQARRTEPMRNIPIERVETGETYANSLEAARAVDGIEKYIVLAAGDPTARQYRGSAYRWLVRGTRGNVDYNRRDRV